MPMASVTGELTRARGNLRLALRTIGAAGGPVEACATMQPRDSFVVAGFPWSAEAHSSGHELGRQGVALGHQLVVGASSRALPGLLVRAFPCGTKVEVGIALPDLTQPEPVVVTGWLREHEGHWHQETPALGAPWTCNGDDAWPNRQSTAATTRREEGS
jgi:hypothetical protein